MQTYSTDCQPAHRRIDYWHHITASFLPTQHAAPVDPKTFGGRLTSLDLGDLRLVELAASGATVTRTREHVGRSEQNIYLVRLVLSGVISLQQGGSEAHLRPGDFVLCDASRTYRMAFRDRSRVLILRVPHECMTRYIGRPDALVGIRMPGWTGASGVASRHLRELWRDLPLVTHDRAHSMGMTTMQLLAAACDGISQPSADRSHAAAALRSRAVDLIERQLSHPGLSPWTIAAALRITPGYLHRIFSAEGETVLRYVMRRRLEECAYALLDPLQSARSITSVAFSFGFSSQPHFCRVFRERFGTTPSEYRRLRCSSARIN